MTRLVTLLEGVEVVVDCTRCDESHTMMCKSCDGGGQLGEGDIRCPVCDGAREVMCDACEGRGPRFAIPTAWCLRREAERYRLLEPDELPLEVFLDLHGGEP